MKGDNGDLYEDKFERVYADIRRLDQLRSADADSSELLTLERVRRLDERLDAQVVAVQAALAAAEKAVAAALSAADKAVGKAEIAQAKVNDTQNEFRGSLRDQAQTLMPRAEAENTFRELRGLISTESVANQELRSRIDVGPPSLSVLQTRSDNAAGRREGMQALSGGAYALLAAIATGAALIGHYLH